MNLDLQEGRWYATRAGDVVKLSSSFWDNCYSASNGLIYDGEYGGRQCFEIETEEDLVTDVTSLLQTKDEPAIVSDNPVDYTEEALKFMQIRHGKSDIATSKHTTHTEYLNFLAKTFDGLLELIRRKNLDYTAGQDDAFANFRRSEPRVDALVGAWVRWGDKVNRVDAYFKRGKLEVVEEGLRDALLDTIGYSAILLALLEENKGDEHI